MNFKKYIFTLLLCISFNLSSASITRTERNVEAIAATWFQKYSQDLKVCLTKYSAHFEAILAIIDLQTQRYEEFKKTIQNHKIANPLKKITSDPKDAQAAVDRTNTVNMLYTGIISRLRTPITELFVIEDALLKQHIDICDITLETRIKIIEDIIKLYDACYDLVENIKITHEKQYSPVQVKVQSKL